ncbi:hypothetical protein [Streptomyces zagrosensis]|uniref:Uncharacterized protein n=1 Tax=Streptomyces zagrosensis TaxID=1042984 RepID=A0A7W9QBB6_9ACTN|nr:hypothetical protein [Streptomyces zagrosensis]MBB5937009.1 hypothetical protein [Streptomyces zagrosensis]
MAIRMELMTAGPRRAAARQGSNEHNGAPASLWTSTDSTLQRRTPKPSREVIQPTESPRDS